MQSVSWKEATLRLGDLVEAAAAGEAVFITKEGVSVQLVARTAPVRKRVFGSAKGMLLMAPDFDAPLDDMSEYKR